MGWVAMLVGVSWTGGGTLLGVQALEISVVCFTSFQDGRGLELDFGWGGGGGMVALGSGDLATSQPQQEAFASFTQTKKKKWSWTLAGYLSTALQSSPAKQELINAACSDGGTG